MEYINIINILIQKCILPVSQGGLKEDTGTKTS